MKKMLVGLFAVACMGTAFAAPAQKAVAAKAKAPTGKVDIVIVESEEYDAGKEDKMLTEGLSRFLEAKPVVTHVAFSQVGKDAKLSGLDYSFLPLYLVKKTPAIRAKFVEPLQQGYVQETDDFVVLARQTRQGVYQDKVSQKGVMEVFVMSQCPYGVRAEDLIIQAKKNGQFPKDKTVKIRYIVNYDPARGFSSLHGSGEWEENVRQLLIAKYYPKQFWKYLEIRNKDYRSSRWDKAMEDAGINVSKIMKKFDTEGLELLKQEANYAKEYGISASPSLLWEGKVKMGLDKAAEVEGFGFFIPRNPSGAAPAVAGSC